MGSTEYYFFLLTYRANKMLWKMYCCCSLGGNFDDFSKSLKIEFRLPYSDVKYEDKKIQVGAELCQAHE